MDFFKLLLVEGLSYFHIVFGDWALAIIALAIGIRIALLPLQVFNHVQQKRLGKIQPEIDRLTSELKADPLRIYKEIQSLKNRNGVRTWMTLILSFAQIPIFLGMYQAISGARNLAGASFAWLPSLATPDAFFILPALVAVTTYLQLKHNAVSTGRDHQSLHQSKEMMGKALPVINFVFMAAMPSSLVLYYAISGIFQLATDSVLKNVIG